MLSQKIILFGKMFSIIIPTLNNLKYLKICLDSISKNSKYEHENIPHINIGDDGTIEYLKSKNINFTHSYDLYSIIFFIAR